MTAGKTPHTGLPASEHLLDGRAVTIRQLTADDREALVSGYKELSPHSVYMRFLGYKAGLSKAELDHLTHQHPDEHLTLGAELKQNGKSIGIGIGRYEFDPGSQPASAEFGVVVADQYHGLGTATLLIKHLGLEARRHGIDFLRGEVLTTNKAMLDVLEAMHTQFEPGRDSDTLLASIPLQDFPE